MSNAFRQQKKAQEMDIDCGDDDDDDDDSYRKKEVILPLPR